MPKGLVFVLCSPLYSGNIGAAARALKNCGFAALRLVNPPAIDAEARRMAANSLDVLRKAKTFDSLADAVADASLVVGFSARGRRSQRPIRLLHEAAADLVARAKTGRVALVFGREDRGLTNDELALCSLQVRIDSAKSRGVFNLAQAVLLAAYELRGTRRPAATRAKRVAGIPSGATEHLIARFDALLASIGYAELADRGLQARIVARARALVQRAGLDASDHAMLLGILRRIEGDRR